MKCKYYTNSKNTSLKQAKYYPLEKSMVYTEQGQQFRKKWGSKKEVWSGDAFMTRGNLRKDDLCLNARRQVVSKLKSEASKVRYKKHGFKKQEEEKVEEQVMSVKEKLALLKKRRRARTRKPDSQQPTEG